MPIKSVNRIGHIRIHQYFFAVPFYKRNRKADFTFFRSVGQCTGLDLELIVRKKEQPVSVFTFLKDRILLDIGICITE